MIEKEFRDLVSSIELDNQIKKENNKLLNEIVDILKDNLKKFYKDAYVDIVNNDIINLEKTYHINFYLEIKNKEYNLKTLNEIAMNAIINLLYLNLKSSCFNNDKDLQRLYDRNKLIVSLKDYNIIFHLFFNKDNISDNLDNFDHLMFLDNELKIEEDYFLGINKKYNKFNDTIKIIKYFLYSNNPNSLIEERLLKYLLSIALERYESDNSFINNLKAFNNALDDLLSGNTLQPSEESYKKYNIKGNFVNSSRFNLYSIVKRSENLLSGNDNYIKDLKELKSKIAMSLPKNGKFMSINVTPNYVSKGKTIEWSFSILGTDITNHGGEYDYNEDNYYMCCYKAMLKGLQFVVKNKLTNNIIIICNTLEPFKNGTLSYENESRFANVLQYIKENDLMIDYKQE